MHPKNIDRSRRFRCFTFLFNPFFFRWFQSCRFNNPRVMNFFKLYHITVPSPITNKTLMDHDRFADKNINTTQNAAHPDANWARMRKARSALGLSRYGARVTLYPIGRRPEISCSRRHSVAGAASARDHDLWPNRKEIWLQVQRVRYPRDRPYYAKRAFFKQNSSF